MATISNTPRPGYVWDSTDNVWYPIGVGAHAHTNAADTPAVIPNALVDAKGDLLTATADNTPARLAVGANNTVLTADSSTATGLKWAAPAGGGKVLQVVSATTATAVANSTNTFADTGLTATITPSATSSKILVIFNQNGVSKNTGNVSNRISLRLLRGATNIASVGDYFLYDGTNLEIVGETISGSILDSPATTSATTYKTVFNNPNNTANVSVQLLNTHTSTITLMEIGA
jgi:hypothetical protein